MQPDYPAAHSMDTAWFAVDGAGHIALFYTGSSGPLPDGAQDNDLQMLNELGHFSTNRAEYRSDMDLNRQTGLFNYVNNTDSDIPDPYKRTLVPAMPRHIDQLPPELRERFGAVRFSNLDFGIAEQLQPLEWYPCTIWGQNFVAYRCADGVTIRPVLGSEEQFVDFVQTFVAGQPEEAHGLIFDCRFWGESVAVLCADGVTVRPIPGAEKKFYDFVTRFFATWPNVARTLVFDGPTD